MFSNTNSVVTNAVYIYLGLVFSGVLFGSFAFALREYLKSPESATEPQHTKHNLPERLSTKTSLAQRLIKIMLPTKISTSTTPKAAESLQRSLPQMRLEYPNLAQNMAQLSVHHSGKLRPSLLLAKWSQRRQKQDGPAISDSDRSDAKVSDSSSQTSQESHDEPTAKHSSIVYSESNLLALRPSAGEQCHSDSVRLSELLLCAGYLPQDLGKPTPEEVADIEALIAVDEPCTRDIGLFRLVALGATPSVYANRVHFHPDFCRHMVSIVDSLTVYRGSTGALQRSLVDLAVVFLWEHWNYQRCPNLAAAAKLSTAKIDAPDPELGLAEAVIEQEVVLEQATVFRLLCNLCLGSPALAHESRGVLPKVAAVLRDCAAKTECHQHRGLVPFIALAVNATERESILAVLYDGLIHMVGPHVTCCVAPADVFLPDSDLQALVLQGLWVGQPGAVRERAARAALLLAAKYPAVGLWSKPVHPEQGAAGDAAPGTWLFYRR